MDGVFDITDDIRFRTNLMYSNRTTDRTVAGYPMQAGTFASSNGGAGVGMAANSYFNPTGAPINNWWRRTWEVPRVVDQRPDHVPLQRRVRRQLRVGDRYFDWDVSYLKNSNKLLQSSYGNLNLANTRLAVGASFLDPAPARSAAERPRPRSRAACRSTRSCRSAVRARAA